MTPAERREAYNADITYGTNNEFGFDYLRDNMAWSLEECVQRGHNFAIVDETDSILIDEARTPLIISGPADKPTKWYVEFANLVQKLERDVHYEVDEKKRTSGILEAGITKVEELLQIGNLYESANTPLISYLNNAIRAKELFKRDKDYVVMNGELLIVDEHTGRILAGRRYSEGMHQALEAKERIEIQIENQTLATITLQNYFRLYEKISGMTGTAMTEAAEFHQIYKLGVVPIPTNRGMQRIDQSDLVYKTEAGKFEAVANDITERYRKGQPVLVGTVSVEKSEELSATLKKHGVPHEVLNAKQHQREAAIIARAGVKGAVTVATNMAGRGTDIMLGGNPEFMADFEIQKRGISPVDNPVEYEAEWAAEIAKQKAAVAAGHEEVIALGGLYVLGTERHESRRIDNQLRGRAGRQGDPGMSRFYLSMEDNLMRIFASDRVRGFMQALGMENGEAIEHRMVTNAIEKAQRKVEGRNFDIRKQLLEYDDVANDQRQVVYQQRNELLESDDIAEAITAIRYDVVVDTVAGFIPPQSLEEQWDIPGLEQHLESDFGLRLPIGQWLEEDKKLHEESLRDRILEELQKAYDEKCERFGPVMREVERQIMLNVLDMLWKEHLANMDHLRQGIGLRAFAQKNPKQEYKRESFELFQQMLDNLKTEVIRMLARVEPVTEEEMTLMEEQRRQAMELEQKRMQLEHAQASGLAAAPEADAMAEAGQEGVPEAKPFVRENAKIGRNDACPCGSGKKFKQCHGRLG